MSAITTAEQAQFRGIESRARNSPDFFRCTSLFLSDMCAKAERCAKMRQAVEDLSFVNITLSLQRDIFSAALSDISLPLATINVQRAWA
jgi:hypothetical protein